MNNLKNHIKDLIRLHLHRKEVNEAIGDEEPPQYTGNVGNTPNQGNQPNISQLQQTQNQPNTPQQLPQQKPEKPVPQVFKVTTEQAADIIRSTRGRIFTVEFIKRTDMTIRVANGRLNVRKFLHGGTLRYSPMEKGLIPFFDMNLPGGGGGYRMINIQGIVSLKVNGIIYVTEENWKRK